MNGECIDAITGVAQERTAPHRNRRAATLPAGRTSRVFSATGAPLVPAPTFVRWATLFPAWLVPARFTNAEKVKCNKPARKLSFSGS